MANFLQKNRSAGFTLIELLMVIAIIALLASIILASLNTAKQRSRDGKRISDIKNIQLALSLYYNDNSCYPPVIYGTPSGTFCNGLTGPAFSPTYMPTVPTDPLNNSNYSYAALNSSGSSGTGNCIAYHLGASLEQTSNSALLNDDDYLPSGSTGSKVDTYPCTSSGNDFSGTSAASGGSACSATNGVAQGSSGATESCYDIHS